MSLAGTWGIRLLGLALTLELAAAAGLVAVRQTRAPAGSTGALSAVEVPREVAVQLLLDARSRALLVRDRAGFLAGVDPQAPDLVAREAARFDAMEQVPLATWSYRLDAMQRRPADPELDARNGTWWPPRLVLRLALAGVDSAPVESALDLAFVQRDDRWYLAADGARAPHLWDEGPVEAVRGASSLVLGHPGAEPELRRLAKDVDAAVARVTAVWGPDWPQTAAVLVPADGDELARLAWQRAPSTRGVVAAPPERGPRLLVEPAALARLDDRQRRVALTAEVSRVAMRPSTGPLVPSWLVEGLAEHVGHLDAGLSVPAAARALSAQVRDGRLPDALPADEDLLPAAPGLDAARQEAWLAVELLVRRYGTGRVLALHRELTRRSAQEPADAVEQALQTQLGTSLVELTTAWRTSLRRQLA